MGSPYTLGGNSTSTIMLKVMLALVPGILAHAWYFGPGIWISLLVCSVFALGFEAFMLLMRGRPLKHALSDNSALLTAWLLALSLPTLAPWWLYAIGMLFAIVVAKQFYGGLGQNLFNPAMIGYAALIVSFPVNMTQWAAPVDLADHALTLLDAFDVVFAGQGSISPDAYTSATVLDTWKTQARLNTPVASILSQPMFGWAGGRGMETVAAMYLLGGLYLFWSRLITWHIPLAFLVGVAASAGLLHLIDPTQHAGPLLHLFSGGVMLGAFFIATDPVTAASTPRGKLIYAGLAGILTAIIRAFGGYPDGVAFAVLLMNICVPFIDTYTQPRVFGHGAGPKKAGKA
ncbi:MAG: electron transport complex subunit RsxD [Hydrogenophilales bacterium 28-61-23]|nr:MAG: electron transport complex subunit RsxD [Hydrogenophilales bacterium 28-61-23]